jgi:hypothetical protein
MSWTWGSQAPETALTQGVKGALAKSTQPHAVSAIYPIKRYGNFTGRGGVADIIRHLIGGGIGGEATILSDL